MYQRIIFLLCLLSFGAQAQKESDTTQTAAADTSLQVSAFPSVEKPVIDLVEKSKEAPKEGGLLSKLFGGAKDPLAEEEEAARGKKKRRKKRRKKNEFEGLEVKRYFARRLSNGKQVEEVFYCIENTSVRPTPYVNDIRYFSTEDKQIVKDSRYQPDKGILLHGPYEKYVDGKLRQRGYYYKGMMHGRWETFTKRGTFKSKEEFYRGWYKGTRFIYYDKAKTKPKEIISFKDGMRDGLYVRFYPSGNVAERGYYKYGEKIYRWVEYYDRGGIRNRKREVQHDSKPFAGYESYVRREWNERGKLVIDRRK